MKYRVKNTLRAMAAHFGLQVKFVDYFDGQTYGKLIVRERRILLNARKSRTEHIFTILHEIGHFAVHHQNQSRDYCPKYLRKDWKLASINEVCSHIRRYLRYVFSSTGGKEWEADLWALCALKYLAKHLGFKKEVQDFLRLHPEKRRLYLLVSIASVWTGAKLRIARAKKISGQLLNRP